MSLDLFWCTVFVEVLPTATSLILYSLEKKRGSSHVVAGVTVETGIYGPNANQRVQHETNALYLKPLLIHPFYFTSSPTFILNGKIILYIYCLPDYKPLF